MKRGFGLDTSFESLGAASLNARNTDVVYFIGNNTSDWLIFEAA